MLAEHAAIRDQLVIAARYAREAAADRVPILGYGAYLLRDERGEVRQAGHFRNLVTQVGDQYYGERAAGIGGAPAAITGMQLGTGTTAPAKTGAGAAIVTLVANSLVALTGTPTSSLVSGARRITYETDWAAGVATANSISEVVLTNQATATQTAAPAANTMARALLSPVVNKAAGDTLEVLWLHDLLGA